MTALLEDTLIPIYRHPQCYPESGPVAMLMPTFAHTLMVPTEMELWPHDAVILGLLPECYYTVGFCGEELRYLHRCGVWEHMRDELYRLSSDGVFTVNDRWTWRHKLDCYSYDGSYANELFGDGSDDSSTQSQQPDTTQDRTISNPAVIATSGAFPIGNLGYADLTDEMSENLHGDQTLSYYGYEVEPARDTCYEEATPLSNPSSQCTQQNDAFLGKESLVIISIDDVSYWENEQQTVDYSDLLLTPATSMDQPNPNLRPSLHPFGTERSVTVSGQQGDTHDE